MPFLDKVKCKIISDEERQTKRDIIFTYLRIFLAEFIATFFFILLGIGCLSMVKIPNWSVFGASVMYGFVFGSCVQLSDHLSYAHLNPAITISYYILRFITLPKILLYWLAQFSAAIVGFILLKQLTKLDADEKQLKSAIKSFGCTYIHKDLGVMKAFIWECIGMSFYVFQVVSAADPRSGTRELYSIKMGFLMAILCFTMLTYTGASFNPVRSFAPAICNGCWENHWVYWTAPFLTAIVVTYFYRLVYWPEERKPSTSRTSKE